MHTIVGSVLKTGSTCNHALPLQNTFQSALVASINSVAVRYHSFCISIMRISSYRPQPYNLATLQGPYNGTIYNCYTLGLKVQKMRETFILLTFLKTRCSISKLYKIHVIISHQKFVFVPKIFCTCKCVSCWISPHSNSNICAIPNSNICKQKKMDAHATILPLNSLLMTLHPTGLHGNIMDTFHNSIICSLATIFFP